MSLEQNSFTEEELQSLKDIFDLFDREKNGRIEMKDLDSIMLSLQRDPSEAKDILKQLDPNHEDFITFSEFMLLMQNIENKIAKSDPNNL